MRKVLLAVMVLFVACVQAARADVNANAAPADEYFGPYKQSVLEIRNRLDDYDKQDVSAMLDPSVPSYLDHLQVAIRDWQSKYPRDPWLPWMLGHLVREYWRAGQVSSTSGMYALADLRGAYPDAAITAQTVAMVYGSNHELARASRDGSEYESTGGAYYSTDRSQVASALPSYAIPDAPAQQYAQAPPPSYQAPPAQEAPATDEGPTSDAAPPADDPQLVYQAPPAEEDRSSDQAPPPEQATADQPAPPAGSDAAYDATRGYDPVRGYDAARGYHVGPNNGASSYDAASTSSAGPPASATAQTPPQ